MQAKPLRPVLRALPLCAAIVGLLAVGCSSEELSGSTSPPGAVSLAPPKQGEGIQLRMVSELDPGLETERCMLIQVGPEGLAYNRSQIEYTSGSHHVLLFETPYTTMPTEDRDGVKLDPTQVHDCPSGGPDRWSIVRVIGGSQNANGDNAIDGMPEGVAMKVAPNSIMLMNAHYLNATSERLATDVRINLYTVPPDTVKQEAGALFYYNPFIRVNAHSKRSAQMRCEVSKDITLLNIQSHMHKRGVGYVANLMGGDGAFLQELYANDRWEEVPIGRFEGGLDIKAGQAIDYRCDYNNNESRDVIQGLTTKDEMCMAVGLYYPRDNHLEACEDEQGELAGTWTGSGTATCGESFSCVLSALKGPPEQLASSYFGCVVDACPGAARELSALVRCQISGAGGACDMACAKASDPSCTECLLDKCGAEITACGAAKCE